MENAVVSEVAAAPAAAAALLSLGGGAQYGLGRDGARGLADGSQFGWPRAGPSVEKKRGRSAVAFW